MDHTQAPVLDALVRYQEAKETPYTPPGHKQLRGVDPEVRKALGDAVFLGDVLAFSGLDDRRSTGGVLQRAQRLMADAVHAEHTFFSTCGSSLSVKAAMLSVAGPHEKLVIGRDAHKSVVAGLIFSGVTPIWVEPQHDAERHLAHPPAADAYERRLAEHPDARGALVTSPTPYGTSAEVSAIAEVCHRRGVPLVVDEAWGAHLPFHDDLPSWAMDAGADVCVTSIHKMGGGLEQGSVFHLQGDLIDPTVLQARADLLGTTSPSVLIHAGMDGWRRQMVLHGNGLLDGALRLAAEVRAEIDTIDGMHVHGREDFTGPGRGADLDPLQTIVDIDALPMNGYQAVDWLRENHHIDLHLGDHRRINAQLTYADDADTAGLLLDALRDLVRHADGFPAPPAVRVPQPDELALEQVLSPRDASFGATEDVPPEQAVGRLAAEMLTPYPPGIPAALPGERLSRPVVDYLTTGVAAGMHVPDAADPALGSVRVATEKD